MGTRLGQHFLRDSNVLVRIAREALPTNDEVVVEIGPGHGELTDALLAEGAKKVIAIERDPSLAAALLAKYGRKGKVEVVLGDVREVLPKLTGNFAVVGNIPYYLTGFLFRLLGELATDNAKLITKITVLVQKEVAERVIATAPRANLLGSMVQGWAEPQRAFTIPRGAFAPAPKVDSTLLVLTPEEKVPREELPRYFETVKKLFRQPRKTLTNNLVAGFSLAKERADRIVRTLGLPASARAAELTSERIKTLIKMVYN